MVNLRQFTFFLPAQCSKRGICYGDAATWLDGYVASHAGIVS